MAEPTPWIDMGVFALPCEAAERKRREWPAVKVTAKPIGGHRVATSFQFGWVDVPPERDVKRVDAEAFVPVSHLPGEFFEDFLSLGLFVSDAMKAAIAKREAVVERRREATVTARSARDKRGGRGTLGATIGDMLAAKKEGGR